MADPTTVWIAISRKRDGWFVITSRDLPGLVIANRNRQVAIDDIEASIKVLFRLNQERVVAVTKLGDFAYRVSDAS